MAILRKFALRSRCELVGAAGIEPTFFGLKGRCNTNFCYTPVELDVELEPVASDPRT